MRVKLFEPFRGVVFFVIIFLVVVEGQVCGWVVVVGDLDDGSRFGKVESVGGWWIRRSGQPRGQRA